MPREDGGHPGGRAGGDVRPEPPEDVPAGDPPRAEPAAQAGVHHLPTG